MRLTYEFGGDDYERGDQFEYEIDWKQVVEAIADYYAGDIVRHLMKKNPNMTTDDKNKLTKARPIIKQIAEFIFRDYDFITEDEEVYFEDEIHAYFEDEAYKEWSSSRTPF